MPFNKDNKSNGGYSRISIGLQWRELAYLCKQGVSYPFSGSDYDKSSRPTTIKIGRVTRLFLNGCEADAQWAEVPLPDYVAKVNVYDDPIQQMQKFLLGSEIGTTAWAKH